MKVPPIVRTRVGPSPTGFCHIGFIRTAILNYLFAKKHGGEFILRIEDTDEKRFVPEAEDYIIKTLNWMGIIPDHGPAFGDGRYGPYRQSERNYRPYVDSLIANGHAYYAFDTAEELDAMRKKSDASGKPFSYNHTMRMYMRNSITLSQDVVNDLLAKGTPYVVRFKTPKDQDVRFTDMVRGTIAFNTSSMDDKVLVKANGVPTYHLAVVVDDHLMGITHVFRGEEWLSSTPLHLLLYDAFEWRVPDFAHLPLLLDESGKKISKRNAVKSGTPIFPFTVNVLDDEGNVLGNSTGLKELGYEPDALFNYMALLGWNPKDNRELMTRDELIEAFDMSGVNSSGAKFDVKKAAHFNRIYLSKRDPKELATYLPENVFNYSEVNLEKIAKAAMERASFAKDIPLVVDYFFKDVDLPIADMKKPEEFPPFLDAVIDTLTNEAWDPEKFGAYLVDLMSMTEALGVNRGAALNNLRLCLTGGASGPKIHEMMDMMGREETLRRLNKAKARLASAHVVEKSI